MILSPGKAGMIERKRRSVTPTGLRHRAFLPYETWDWHVRWYERCDLDADHRHVHLSTARRQIYLAGWQINLGLQESYTFDLATGEMLDRQSTGRWRVWLYFAVG